MVLAYLVEPSFSGLNLNLPQDFRDQPHSWIDFTAYIYLIIQNLMGYEACI